MVDVNVSSIDISTVTGPSSISVQVGLGQKGERGSKIFVGETSPQLFFAPAIAETFGLKTYDLYINTNSADSDYLYLYQFVPSETGNVWQQMTRIAPTEISISENITFTAGSATLLIDLLEYYPSSLFEPVSTSEPAVLSSATPVVVATSQSSFPVAISVSDATLDIETRTLSIDLVAAKLVGSVSALAEAVTLNINVNFVFPQSEIS